jgi:Conserved TM helix
MEQFRDGLGDAWATVATFIPKFIAFLLILVIGYFVARAIAKAVDAVLERVGFDRAVERGGVGRALARSQYDASGLLGKLAFYVVMLFVLQLAFGMFGPNPVSELITGVVAYLPNVFAAILIVVIGSAIAAAVKEIVEASLGGLSYGRGLAIGASTAILVVTIFAALDQLNIAENIVIGLFYALLAIVVGASVVAIGGGGIKTMQRYWDRAADRADRESSSVRSEMGGAGERIRRRAEERMDQARSATTEGSRTSPRPPVPGEGLYEDPQTVSPEKQPPRR